MALFDFTSLFAAEHSSRIIRRHGKTLLLMLAGDSLLEVTMVTAHVSISYQLTPTAILAYRYWTSSWFPGGS